MKNLERLLEETLDGKELVICFHNGDVLGLADFEMVDQSIYDRSDLCVANIVSPIRCKEHIFKAGGKIEFSLDEIVQIYDAATKEIRYPVSQ